MANLLDGLLPGNRVFRVNGVRPAITRDLVDISCSGASIVDDAAAQSTRITIPGGSVGAWTAFTPALSSSGGGFALGNGAVYGQWRLQSGDAVELQVAIVVGSTTAFGSGTLQIGFTLADIGGNWVIDTTRTANGTLPLGHAWLQDASTPANNRFGQIYMVATDTIGIIPVGSATGVGAANPFTWATDDGIQIGVTLPAKLLGV